MKLYFRKVKKSDCDRLFKWANDQRVRRNAFNTKYISYNEHLHWFNRKMKESGTKIFILELGSKRKPVGQVRFERIGKNKYKIDISIDSNYHNQGIGTSGLRKCCEYLINKYKAKSLIAQVKSKNRKSIRCFKKAGFNIFKLKNDVLFLSVMQKDFI
jgi:spore coat polysaccharide biosynthesis protein SpsF